MRGLRHPSIGLDAADGGLNGRNLHVFYNSNQSRVVIGDQMAQKHKGIIILSATVSEVSRNDGGKSIA